MIILPFHDPLDSFILFVIIAMDKQTKKSRLKSFRFIFGVR